MSDDATKVIIQGLKNMSGKPSRGELRKTLIDNITTFSVQGATTEVRFEPKGGRQRIEKGGLGVLVQVKCYNSSCDFVKLDGE